MENRKASSILCLFTILLATLTFTSKTQAASPDVTRISGLDRYETNLSIVKKGWAEAPNVIIANGENFPDALCAAPLAKSKNAPIILTSKDKLNSSALEELAKLKTKNVYIIGGTGVISSSIENQLKELGITCTRLAGEDRFETSVKVAEQLTTENGIAIASGENFPDALSIAPIAAKMDMPILLSSKDSLPNKVSTYLEDKNIPVSYVVGGVGVLSSDIKSSLKNPKRLSGMDRYETNIRVLNEFQDSLDLTSMFVASANNFPDALSGSVLASNYNAPIVLVDNAFGQATYDFLKQQNCKTVNILGGTGAVDAIAEYNLTNMVKYSNIVRVDDISDIAFINEDYHFPPKAIASFEDGSTKFVPVLWNSKKVDTSKAAAYQFEGTVSGYDGKVKLNLNVVADTDGSTRNIGNGTNVAYYKGYLYYSTSKDGNKVYRIKDDGTELTKISDDYALNINIADNHIYYSNSSDSGKIYRMNLDGSDKTKIIDKYSVFTVVKNYIYYSYKNQQESGFYRINTDGSNNTKLSNDYTYYSMSIADNYIYYANSNDNDSIYKMKIDGSGKTKLCSDSSTSINLEDGWIYYEAADGTFTEKGPGYKLYKIKTDGTERTKISDDFPASMIVYNGWIYYRSRLDGDNLYKIRVDGSNKTQLTSIRSEVISIIGGLVFYQAMDYSDGNFMIRLDGTSNSRFISTIISEKESNDTFASAMELNSSQNYGNAAPIRGRLEKDDVDFFKITASTSGYLNITFVSPSIGKNAVVTLMDVNGKTIYSTPAKYNGVTSFATMMYPGATCYIKLSSPHGELIESGLYDLSTWFTPAQ
ncbi:cell wall-binding repeat-containing protein [Clostridium sp. PL3]|uniref:Cell wall-binding repeat-containing protein n=1 Tax=Clostridium thailandense TaxID=2794346 RepID=A0A949TER6_9CLOT|nr:cell wall-binding repeat-containing protein [Clostridium thailandense]MBV7271434.1 cell wall-binding repeat-containing protein [Clostridium thailandense]